MGAMSELYTERMRGPEPEQGDEDALDLTTVLALASAIQARHERTHPTPPPTERAGVSTTMDEHEDTP